MHSSTVILIAFLTSIITTTGTVVVFQRTGYLTPDAQTAAVPDLKGLTERDARANLDSVGLVLLVGASEQSAEAKPGTVIRQAQPPGQKLDQGKTVTVTLAEELPKVPSVVGQTVAEATVLLQQKGYKVAVSEKAADPEVPEGKIISQVPAADAAYEKEGSVAVRVSTGPGTVEVPKLVGVGLNGAKAELEKIGLKPAVRWISQAETASFVVLQQKPEPGTKVDSGADVEVIVNR